MIKRCQTFCLQPNIENRARLFLIAGSVNSGTQTPQPADAHEVGYNISASPMQCRHLPLGILTNDTKVLNPAACTARAGFLPVARALAYSTNPHPCFSTLNPSPKAPTLNSKALSSKLYTPNPKPTNHKHITLSTKFLQGNSSGLARSPWPR